MSSIKAKPYIKSVYLKPGYDKQEYPFTIPAVTDVEKLVMHKDVTFFIGENGTGKSTVLEAIAVSFGLGWSSTVPWSNGRACRSPPTS